MRGVSQRDALINEKDQLVRRDSLSRLPNFSADCTTACSYVQKLPKIGAVWSRQGPDLPFSSKKTIGRVSPTSLNGDYEPTHPHPADRFRSRTVSPLRPLKDFHAIRAPSPVQYKTFAKKRDASPGFERSRCVLRQSNTVEFHRDDSCVRSRMHAPVDEAEARLASQVNTCIDGWITSLGARHVAKHACLEKWSREKRRPCVYGMQSQVQGCSIKAFYS
jgi:hypothetical protein